jgi:BolA family transcriptional regulator, general stress-responsive regulator
MNRLARIQQQLQALDPTVLEVINESAQHHGHAGDDGSGESHLLVRISAKAFAGQTKLSCHRMVYDMLKVEFSHGLHALRIETIE